MSTKIEKMGTLLRAFIKQVQHDLKVKAHLYVTYDEEGRAEALVKFDHESWLYVRQPM